MDTSGVILRESRGAENYVVHYHSTHWPLLGEYNVFIKYSNITWLRISMRFS
jgi:hypothetical protein